MIEAAPLPARDGPFEQGFWEALDAGILAHQRCEACCRWHFPPRFRCDACGGALAYQPVSGRARLWSYIEVHPPVLPAFAALTPYLAAVVELVEQPGLRMAGHLVRRPDDPINRVRAADVAIGMPLRAAIVPLSPEVSWPRWMIMNGDDDDGR